MRCKCGMTRCLECDGTCPSCMDDIDNYDDNRKPIISCPVGA